MDIYALRDPRNHEIRYIGASEDPLRRWREHVFDPQGEKASWVKELDEQGLMPELEVLAERVGDNWRDLERDYIQALTRGGRHRLFNRQGNTDT